MCNVLWIMLYGCCLWGRDHRTFHYRKRTILLYSIIRDPILSFDVYWCVRNELYQLVAGFGKDDLKPVKIKKQQFRWHTKQLLLMGTKTIQTILPLAICQMNLHHRAQHLPHICNRTDFAAKRPLLVEEYALHTKMPRVMQEPLWDSWWIELVDAVAVVGTDDWWCIQGVILYNYLLREKDVSFLLIIVRNWKPPLPSWFNNQLHWK